MILLILIITGCATTPKTNKVLPPTPERTKIQKPTSEKEFLELLIYYEFLVQEWEAWGDTAKQVIQD